MPIGRSGHRSSHGLPLWAIVLLAAFFIGVAMLIVASCSSSTWSNERVATFVGVSGVDEDGIGRMQKRVAAQASSWFAGNSDVQLVHRETQLTATETNVIYTISIFWID